MRVRVIGYPFERLVEIRVDRVDVLRDERAEVAVQLCPPGVDRRRVRHHRASVHEQRDEDRDRRRTQAVTAAAPERCTWNLKRQTPIEQRTRPEASTTSAVVRGEETSRQLARDSRHVPANFGLLIHYSHKIFNNIYKSHK